MGTGVAGQGRRATRCSSDRPSAGSRQHTSADGHYGPENGHHGTNVTCVVLNFGQDEPQSATNAAEAQTPARERDVPSVRELRSDYNVKREVNRRLAELDMEEDEAEPSRTASRRTRSKRSGAAKTVQDKVVRDIDWPHFHIYTQPDAEPMTFAGLSIPEFTYGFLHMVDQPDANFDRGMMWSLLILRSAIMEKWINSLNIDSLIFRTLQYAIVGQKVSFLSSVSSKDI